MNDHAKIKRLLVTILLVGFVHMAGYADMEIDGVYYHAFDYTAGVVSHETAEGNYVGLTHANIRDSVSFDGVKKLPVTTIQFIAFQEAPDLVEVSIPNTVTHIAEAAFNNCPKLRSITIPNSVVTIDEWGIAHNASLKKLHLGSGAVYVDDSAIVGNTALEVITVDENNPVFDSRNNCNGIIKVVNNSMVHNRSILFTACSKTIIPQEVTFIGQGAYQEQEITSVSLPSHVTGLQYACFQGCEFLTSIYNYSSEPQSCLGTTFEDYHYDYCTLYVPLGSKETYENAGVWKYFQHIEEFDPDLNPWDVNGDGEVTVADANSAIHIIINGGNSSGGHSREPGDDDTFVGDVNGDGEITIADFNAIIDYILRN